MSESEITELVRKYRAIVIFANQRTGASRLMTWFKKEHNKYTQYEEMFKAVTDLGYTVNDDAYNDEYFDEKNGLFKDVILQYNKDRDIEKLELAIKTIMSFRPSFKIINEYTLFEVAQTISKYINYFHYSAIFLHRRKSLQRLLSLWFAHKTGAYTPEQAKKIVKKKIKPLTLDVDYLINEQKKCNQSNIKIWETLRRAGCRYVAISYEDLYSDMADSTILHICFRWLFYQVWDFTEIKQSGKMNLDKYYYEMKGIEELEQALEKVDKPNFGNMHVDV